MRSGIYDTRMRNHHSKKSDAATWKPNMTKVVWVPTYLSSFCNRCVRILITVRDYRLGFSRASEQVLVSGPRFALINQNGQQDGRSVKLGRCRRVSDYRKEVKDRPARTTIWFLWLHCIIKCLRVTFLLLQACLSEIYLFCRRWSEVF